MKCCGHGGQEQDEKTKLERAMRRIQKISGARCQARPNTGHRSPFASTMWYVFREVLMFSQRFLGAPDGSFLFYFYRFQLRHLISCYSSSLPLQCMPSHGQCSYQIASSMLTILRSFYCIVLISSIFVSSCYWQPFSLDTSLAVPWADNITTYGEALLSTLSPDVATTIDQLPSSIRAVDRCWCDISSGTLFEPFNMTRWEHTTVNKMKEDLEKRRPHVPAANTTSVAHVAPKSTKPGLLWSLFSRSKSTSPSSTPEGDGAILSIPGVQPHTTKIDLHPYGVNMLVDFGWSQ